jgi:hypothetical protein
MNFPRLPSMPSLPTVAAKVGTGLKALPTIAFALMLGAAFVITAFVVWYTIIIGYNYWPESAAEARINALAVALWIFCGGIILTLVTLAFGKIEKLSVSGSVVSGEIEFDDGDDDDDRRHRRRRHDDDPCDPEPGFEPPGPHRR